MTEASTGTGSEARAALPAGPVWQAGLLAALAATVVNGIVWLLLQQVFDVGLEIPSQPGGTELTSLPLSAMLFITAFSSLVGAVILWLLTRRGPSGIRPLGHPGRGLRGPVGPARLRARHLDRPPARPGPVPPAGHRDRAAVVRQQLARWTA
jgi:hypothetical protein